MASDTFTFLGTGSMIDLVIAAAGGPTNGVWTNASGGTWSTAGNWSTAVPGGAAATGQDTATFSTPPTSSTATVTLDSSRSLAGIGFNTSGGSGYAIAAAASTCTLTLANTLTNTATISNSGGGQTISAPIILGDKLSVTASTGSALTIAGSITESSPDMSLSVSGGGALILSGTDRYTGGTNVAGSTLALAEASALPTTGLLTIGSGGRLVLGGGAGIGELLGASSPISSGAIALSAAASISPTIESTSGNMATLGGAVPASLQGGAGSAVGGSAAAVPEPGTLALLAVAVLSLAAVALRKRG